MEIVKESNQSISPELSPEDPGYSSEDSPIHDESFKTSFDKVMRSLVSEVDEQRHEFDKKWKMLVQYLMRKHDEQETLIRKLKTKLQQYETKPQQDMGRNVSQEKRRSDPILSSRKRYPSPVKEKPANEESENDQDFDQFEAQLNYKLERGSPYRYRRFYSLGNKINTLQSTLNKIDDSKQNPENDMVSILKSKLCQAKVIIKNDQLNKIKLVEKMREMKNQLIILQQIKNDTQQIPILVNIKIQTDQEQINLSSVQRISESIGINTESLQELEFLQKVKISHDQFEENRLRDNIQFWKSKVDQLLLKQKDTLQIHLTQNKTINSLELQLEEVKQQLRLKNNFIESLQLSKDMIEQRINLPQEAPQSDSSVIIIDMENNKNELAYNAQSSTNSAIENNHQPLIGTKQPKIVPVTLINQYYSPQHPSDKISQKLSPRTGNKNGKIKKNKYLVDLTSKSVYSQNQSTQKQIRHQKSQSKTPSSLNKSREIANSTKRVSKKQISRNEMNVSHVNSMHKNSINLGQKNSARHISQNQGTSPFQKPPSNSHLQKGIKTVSTKQNQTIVEVLGKLQNQDDETFEVHAVNEQDNSPLSPMSQVKNILEAFKASQFEQEQISAENLLQHRSPQRSNTQKESKLNQQSAIKTQYKSAGKIQTTGSHQMRQNYTKMHNPPPSQIGHSSKMINNNTKEVSGGNIGHSQNNSAQRKFLSQS